MIISSIIKVLYLQKTLIHKLQKLLNAFPAVIIASAHQVGKSTLLHELFPTQADHVTSYLVIDIENARQDPDLFLDNHRLHIILNEIQYVPELVSALKRKIDKNRAQGLVIAPVEKIMRILEK